MVNILRESLKRSRKSRAKRMRLIAILLVLSLVVSLDVFWVLRQPGWTLAGDADCRIVEHTHDEGCENPCPLEEHTHNILCYTDKDADLETQLDWQRMFADYPYTENLRENLVGIAKMQVGYTESTYNFEVGDDGIRRGYTRYGAWYGAPYSDWSAMFVSFCLHYAGADPEEFPGNIGAGAMAEHWKGLEIYADAGTYEPVPGDLVFFTDNTMGIVAEVYTNIFYVIRGDMDGAVKADALPYGDSSIAGWGITYQYPAPTEEIEQTQPEKTPISQEELLDISNGPAMFVLEGENAVQIQRYASRATRTVTELLPYLEENGGSYFFTLLDFNNMELPRTKTATTLPWPTPATK